MTPQPVRFAIVGHAIEVLGIVHEGAPEPVSRPTDLDSHEDVLARDIHAEKVKPSIGF